MTAQPISYDELARSSAVLILTRHIECRAAAPLPDFLRSKATDRNIAPETIDALWQQHTKWCEAHEVIAGGKPWEAFLDAVVSKTKETRALSDIESLRLADATRKAVDARKAKDGADADYARQAVNLSDWLGELRAREDFYEPVTKAEQRLMDFRAPAPGEDPTAWLMAALGGRR